MKVSDLRRETKKLDVVIPGLSKDFVVQVEYRWRALRFGFWDDQQNSKLDGQEKAFEYLKELLVSWNLLDDDGKVIPIEYEAVKAAKVPDELLELIRQAITVDMYGDADTKKA